MSENHKPKIVIKDCYSTGTVTAGDNSKYIGGFIGGIGATQDTEVIIDNSWSEGDVIVGENAQHIGAFIGGIYDPLNDKLLEHTDRLLAVVSKTNFNQGVKAEITQATLMLQDKIKDESLTPEEAGRIAQIYEYLKRKVPPFLSIGADIAQIVSLLYLLAS